MRLAEQETEHNGRKIPVYSLSGWESGGAERCKKPDSPDDKNVLNFSRQLEVQGKIIGWEMKVDNK